MELKLIHERRRAWHSNLLIVPYGIETQKV